MSETMGFIREAWLRDAATQPNHAAVVAYREFERWLRGKVVPERLTSVVQQIRDIGQKVQLTRDDIGPTTATTYVDMISWVMEKAFDLEATESATV